MSAASITFDQLQNCLTDRVDRPLYPRKASLPNLVSALNAFIKAQGLEPMHPVGSTLRLSYYKGLEEHLGALRAEGRSPAFIANRKSALKVWKKLMSALDRESAAQNGSVTPLQAALQEVLSAGATIKGLARAVGMSSSVLSRLCSGGAPTRRSMRYLPRLEVFLGMTPGTLTDLLGVNRAVGTEPPRNPAIIPYRQTLACRVRDTYALKKAAIGDTFVKEWTSLVDFKTATVFAGRIVRGGPAF